MSDISLYIPGIPENWASFRALEELFKYHAIGSINRTVFSKTNDGVIGGYVYFAHWYDTPTSCDMRNKLLSSDEPEFIATNEGVASHVFTIYKLDAVDTNVQTDINQLKNELISLRRATGNQCMTCDETNHLEEDEEEWGKFYCPACWYEWNNSEAIRSKEREIKESQIKINTLWTSENPNSAYQAEELLEHIQELRDEITMLQLA
jgi:hypothetical protein